MEVFIHKQINTHKKSEMKREREGKYQIKGNKFMEMGFVVSFIYLLNQVLIVRSTVVKVNKYIRF